MTTPYPVDTVAINVVDVEREQPLFFSAPELQEKSPGSFDIGIQVPICVRPVHADIGIIERSF